MLSRLSLAAWCLVLALVLPCWGENMPNLVSNSSFEQGPDLGGAAEGWAVPGIPDGGVNRVTNAKARTGRFCHQITVPAGTKLNWYQVNQVVPGAASGRTFTLSVYIQTEDVRDGAGAYSSINCFDGTDKRIGVFDAPTKVSGTGKEWRRQTVTTTIPKGTVRTVVILTLYGHGTAWFDDVQLEEGTKATEYGPSAADQEAQRQLEQERNAAEAFRRGVKMEAGQRGVVAIFRDSISADGCASSPERFGKWLEQAGYAPVYLNAEQLSNRFILRGPRSGEPVTFDLLVLPYGGAFPASAARAVKAFLQQGGAFFSTGGYAFDTQLVRYDGRWFRPQDLPMPSTPTAPVLSFDDGKTGEWSLGSDAQGRKPALSVAPGPKGGGESLQFSVTPMHVWATASIPVGEKLPKDWAVTRFWAKGDANTPKMVIEWTEKDASRWKTSVPLTTEWKEYILGVGDFAYWHDNPSVGRGGTGDPLRPAQAARLQFGVAMDIVAQDQPHMFWIADVRVQADPLAALRTPPPGTSLGTFQLNTRSAKIRDAMWPTPDQIPVFDPGHCLRWVRSAKAAPGQYIVPTNLELKGNFEGYSAVGMLSNQGHGFGPNLSRLVPILEALDRFGRYRGPLGSVMHTYDGQYAGASWAFFGVTNKDLFGHGAPHARELFLDTVAHLLRRVYMHDTDTEFSCYRGGETMTLRTRVSNFGRQPAQAEVRMELLTPDGASLFSRVCGLSLSANSTESVAVECPVPPAGPDLCLVRATLLLDGKPMDVEENAVSLWDEQADRPSGPVQKRDAYFSLSGRPIFPLGCQTYWGQNGSVTARSPLAFERDFAMMQDYGLHFSRAFIPFETDSDRRQSDAIVQLAQKHRILIYHTPNLHNTATPEELAEEAGQAKTIGERYRAVPWMMVDICNEPSLNVGDEKLVPAFNDFLKQRYGTTERLRQAWGPNAPEIGKAKPEKLSDRWDALRSFDTNLFLCEVQRRWAEQNRAAIRSGDATRLASVGFMQGYGGADRVWDPIIASRELDFTDRHYYGPPPQQRAQLKDIDMRAVGKPFIQGECGAKDHPTFAAQDPWGMGDNDEKFNRRFQYLVHHAFGLGAAALSSWHWRDPMEGIFPCGIVLSDRVPRPAASVMRAMAFTIGRLRPRYETPQLLVVVPENHRLGGSREAVTKALHRAEELLIGCQVDFGLISENQLDRVPKGVRALVYPVPYCPPDETVAALKRFVGEGGALYFSGDISYAPDRKLTRAQRLPELAGVERDGAPNAPPYAKPISIRTKDAEVLTAGADGKPAVTLKKLGKGFVLFCADPMEIAKEPQPSHRALYLDFLNRANVARNPVDPDTATLECYRVPLEMGGQAFVLYNADKSPVKATLKLAQPVTLDLAGETCGLIVVDAQGRLTAVEAQGAVSRSGKTLLTINGLAIIHALDDRDIAESARLLILPMPTPGRPSRIALPSLAKMRIEMGEVRQTSWRCLQRLKAKRGVLAYDEEQSLNMILAASPREFAEAVREVEGFTKIR